MSWSKKDDKSWASNFTVVFSCFCSSTTTHESEALFETSVKDAAQAATKPTQLRCEESVAQRKISARNYSALRVRTKGETRNIWGRSAAEPVCVCLSVLAPHCLPHKTRQRGWGGCRPTCCGITKKDEGENSRRAGHTLDTGDKLYRKRERKREREQTWGRGTRRRRWKSRKSQTNKGRKCKVN